MDTPNYDLCYEDSPQYEEGYLALPFSIFSSEHTPPFETNPNEKFSKVVEEVYAHRRKNHSQSYEWFDIIAVNNSKAKRELFKKYFNQENPNRLFRLYISFYLRFNHWIHASQPIPDILKQLKTRQDTLSLVMEWIEQGKLIITDKLNDSALIYFLVTPDIFHDVLTHPDISYEFIDQETVTLSQDHYKNASAKSFRLSQKS